MISAISIFLAAVLPCAEQSAGPVFRVRDYGARGDAVTKDTAAIQKAIDACGAAGGGRVVFGKGTFLTGTLFYRSGVDLHLEADARLLGSPDCADYPWDVELKHVDRTKAPRDSATAMIIADECRNIALTGEGTIDVSGYAFVEKRPLKPGEDWTGWEYRRKPGLRIPPRVVLFAGCQDVLIRDVTMTNQPAGWSYWVTDCDRVICDSLKILANVRYPNNDGLHINASRDVRITNCWIETGDDSIVLRANCRALKENRPCERVTVSNCRLRSFANGIRLGWVNDGTVRNCSFSNITISDSATGIGIVLPPPTWGPSDVGRESTLIEKISFSDIVMDRIYAHPILASLSGHESTRITGVRDLSFSNMHCRALQFPYVAGRERNHFERFTFSDCTFEKVPESAFPEPWRKQGAASWDRHLDDKFYHAEGFIYERCRFDCP